MNIQNYLRLIAALFLIHFLTGCEQDSVSKEPDLPFDHIGSVQSVPGFGKQEGPPKGIPFELPNGLKLVSRNSFPFDPSVEKLFGNMNTFYVDINIVPDETWGGGFVEFPPGLVMLPTTPGGIQNGMLMDRVRIPVPKKTHKSSGDTTTFYLGVACMNASKGFPWEDNFTEDTKNYVIGKGMYKPTVITTEPEVLKFISLLADRPGLKLTRHHNPWDAFDENYVEPDWMKPYTAVQLAFWKMTDGHGLLAADLQELLDVLNQN
ncbi:hypothetical protein [Sphingobacterium suaedae]|uniref:Uncharacterized protein n=1 Tax=Sphingobacterium suaedae TaxID=1686402 RepID=A0ABW5KKC7_9SPHI